jgi:DeoR/GlpR family transcriptional regulator of sugar metabolism
VQSARDRDIVALLRAQGMLRVEDLSAALAVGPATIRRNLQRLARSGQVVRTYGGAILPGVSSSNVPELSWKGLIAAEAAELIEDGETIVISSGSTTLELARRLVGRRLTVITNTLDVAYTLMDQASIELIVLGGHVRPKMHSLLGHLTELVSRELRADRLFMSIPALSIEHGLMSSHMPEILTDRALRQMVGGVVLLADATKIGRMAPAFVFGLDEIDTLVTDRRVPTETLSEIGSLGIRVLVARDFENELTSRTESPVARIADHDS